ncbi:MAG: hypothetical protein KTR25_20255 [Myxococcales bacterium]|nr:hypothetical protein [Myxococcales bacterium]
MLLTLADGQGLAITIISVSPIRVRVSAQPAFANRHLNPYNARIYEHMEDYGVSVYEYRVPPLWGSGPDIFHVHWPEAPFNHRWITARIATESLLASIRWMKSRGTKVVWTIHNLSAHERKYPGCEERFWQRFIPQLDGVIALSESSLMAACSLRPELSNVPRFVVAHPHYRGEYADSASRSEARRRLGIDASSKVLTFFGQIRDYKNVPSLVETVNKMPNVQLLVAGRSRDARLSAELVRLVQSNPSVRLYLRHIPSDEAQWYLRAADLVVLPYRQILNSGSAILALSFDRAVWLPSGPLPQELEGDVPGGWIQHGVLRPEALYAALSAVTRLPETTDGRHLNRFSPRRVAEETAGVYHRLLDIG